MVRGARTAGWSFGLLIAGMTACAAATSLPDFAGVYGANRQAVVNISSTEVIKRSAPQWGFGAPGGPLEHFFRNLPHNARPRRLVTKSLGSGFIIGSDGYILTCAHVIDHAQRVIVKLADRRDYVARVVGLDTKSDVGLLKIPATHLATVKIGHPSRLRTGDWVLAVGAPFGFKNSATAGIVSAVGRSLPGSDYVPFIQTDVPINPGNSGGPLFNSRGRVIGINSQIYSRTGGFMGLSFAIPINLAMRVGHALRTSGHMQWAWLGVTIQDVTRRLALAFHLRRPHGALVSEVIPGSPAAHSSLAPGDVIVRYDGHAIRRSAELPPLVGLTPVGSLAHLRVIRDGRPERLAVAVGALPNAQSAASVKPPRARRHRASLGLALRPLSAAERRALKVAGGVLVEGVSAGPGEKAGIRPGDVILSVAGRPVDSVRAFRRILTHIGRGPVPVLIHRDGAALFLALSKN